MKNSLEEISKNTIERYNKRFELLGEDVKSLGWGDKEQQNTRFMQVGALFNFSKKSVLDIGCGFADLNTFFEKNNIDLEHYIGWDINENFLDVARKRYPESLFEIVDLTTLDNVEVSADIGIMLGLLNFKLDDIATNIEYSKRMIKKAFDSVRKALVVDFLSLHICDSYPKEDAVFYHNPSEMLQFALELTPNVRLIHNYQPIPQKEFMLVLEHV